MDRRETAVNVLLGVVLLGFFAVPVIVSVVIFGCAVQLLELAIETYLPGDRHLWFNLLLYGTLSLWPLQRGITCLHTRLWRNALLSFAIVPMMMSLALTHSGMDDSVLFAAPLWLVVYTTSDSVLSRLELLLSGFVISLTIATNIGLLGAGTLAQGATYCVYAAMWFLFGIWVRREQNKHNVPGAVLN